MVLGELDFAHLADLTTATAGLLEQGRKPLKDSIEGIDQLSKQIVGGKADVEQALTVLPGKLAELGRINSYGSWMNFYLCSAVLRSDPPRGVPATAERCTS